MYRVKDVLKWIGIKSTSRKVVTDIVEDASRVTKNSIFLARKGTSNDGKNYIDEALKNGAALILSDEKINNAIYLPDFFTSVSIILRNFYEIDKIKIIGITGTSGKSSTAYILHSLYRRLNVKSFLITTTRNIPDSIVTDLTTPSMCDLAKIINQAILNKYEYVIMECSSIGIATHRLDFIKLHYLIINKITSDHLDYHKTKSEYRRVKLDFAKNFAEKIYTFYGYREIKRLDNAIVFSKKVKDYYGNLYSSDFIYNHKRFALYWPFKYNVENFLIVYNALLTEGFKEERIRLNMMNIPVIPGRMEMVKPGENVFIDYAHTYPALNSLLKSIAKLRKYRIIAICGAGGNRDKSKRKMYRKSLARYSYKVIITDDNPRDEDEDEILNELKGKEHFIVIKDRKEAIEEGIRLYKSTPSSVLVIIGKGDEDYQIIKGKTFHFSDREEAIKCLS